MMFVCPDFSFALQLDKLTVAGHDVTNLDYIEVHKEDLIRVKKKVWEEASKWSIAVEGSLYPSSDVSKVHYSLNGGMGFFRAQGEDPFYFTFVPVEGATFPVVIKFYNKREEVIFTRKIDVKYTAIDWLEFFKDEIEAMRRAYENRALKEFISYFYENEFPDLSQLQEDLAKTFDENDEIKLSITVKSLDMSLDGAVVEVNWRKTFEDDSFQESQNSNINFKEKKGVWRIVSISDESMFIIGSGKLHIIY